jgi:hAT family C-terminal dimerisation region
MQQMICDHLSTSVMRFEIKRAFNSAKPNLLASRNRLGPDILKAQEYIRKWLKARL